MPKKWVVVGYDDQHNEVERSREWNRLGQATKALDDLRFTRPELRWERLRVQRASNSDPLSTVKPRRERLIHGRRDDHG